VGERKNGGGKNGLWEGGNGGFRGKEIKKEKDILYPFISFSVFLKQISKVIYIGSLMFDKNIYILFA